MGEKKTNSNIQELNNELLTYFKSNNIADPSVELKEDLLSLDKKILSYSMIVDLILMFFLIIMFAIIDDLGYKILVTLSLTIIAYMLIIEFQSINLLKISFEENKMIVIPKNIFRKRVSIEFDHVVSVEINLKFFQSMYRRFRIKLKLKNNEDVILTDFNIEKHAVFFLNYLKKIIK